MEFKQLNQKNTLSDIVKQLNIFFGYIAREFNRLNKREKDERIITAKAKKFHPFGGDNKVSLKTTYVGLSPVDSVKVPPTSLFVDYSDNKLYFKDINGISHSVY